MSLLIIDHEVKESQLFERAPRYKDLREIENDLQLGIYGQPYYATFLLDPFSDFMKRDG